MRAATFLVAITISFAFADRARAQGKISWDGGYAVPGVAKGSIAVFGSLTLDAGWRPIANSAVIEVWEDGAEVILGFVPLRGKGKEWTWGGISEKLASNRTYNVIARVKVTDGTSVETLVTAPRRTKTK